MTILNIQIFYTSNFSNSDSDFTSKQISISCNVFFFLPEIAPQIVSALLFYVFPLVQFNSRISCCR